ncbi:coiled-coil domain-containing protein 87-like [Lytechinus pictus]|uniref:coiled-coil domain-containing protein 87-like n=1 Tax=Lytechinus pictus TaxID=7653 RepID=UPI0030B9FA39
MPNELHIIDVLVFYIIQLEQAGPREFRLPRSRSLPEFHLYESIYEEIGFDPPSKESRPRSSYRHRPKYNLDESDQEEDNKKSEAHPTVDGASRPTQSRPYSSSYIKQDLEKLSAYRSAKTERKREALPEEEDLPPLLQLNSVYTGAVDHNERQEQRRVAMRHQMKETEAEADKKEQEELIKIREPTYPQPATVTTKMPNKSTIRTSDVRVSERVSQTAVTINLYKTVFNELTDDVDGTTIKKLDANLFRGQEIKEVYEEILKTLPTDHMTFDMVSSVSVLLHEHKVDVACIMETWCHSSIPDCSLSIDNYHPRFRCNRDHTIYINNWDILI